MINRKFSSILFLVILSGSAYSQDIAVNNFNGGIGVLSLVLLGTLVALAASFFLLRIGTATGFSVIKSMLGGKSDSKKTFDPLLKPRLHERAKKIGSSIKLASHSFGVMNAFIIGASLFVGSYFASDYLGPVSFSHLVGMGLFIWAAYSMTVKYIKKEVVSESISPVLKMATRSASSSAGGLKSLVNSEKRSQRKEIKKLAKEVIGVLKDEMDGTFENSKVSRQLDKLIKEVEGRDVDSKRLLFNLAEILNHTEIKLVHSDNENGERLFVNTDVSEVKFQSPTTKKTKALFERAAKVYHEEDSAGENLKNVAAIMSPGTEEDAHQFMTKVEKFLRESDDPELSPEKLKADFNEFLDSPKDLKHKLSQKLDAIDTESLFDSLVDKTPFSKEQISKKMEVLKNMFSGHDHDDNILTEHDFHNAQQLKDNDNTLYGTFLDPSELQHEFDEIINEPSKFSGIVKERFSKVNKDDVRSILESKTSLSGEKIDTYFKKFDSIRRTAKAGKYGTLATIKDAKISVKTLSKDISDAGSNVLWWRAAASMSGAAGSVGGALVAAL